MNYEKTMFSEGHRFPRDTEGREVVSFQAQQSVMDETNEFFRATVPANGYYRATVLANQTVKRLQREGFPTDEAKRLVLAVINTEESLIMKHRQSFNEERVTERLKQLPEMPWSNA